MSSRKKSLIEQVISLAIIGGIFYLLFVDTHHHSPRDIYRGAPKSTTPAPQIGYPAPDFELQSVDGKTVRLSNLRGKVVLLSFWAPWCSPCRAEMPSINRLYQRLGNTVEVLAVATNYDSKMSVKTLVRSLKFKPTVLLDQDDDVGDLYQIRSLPTNFIIDTKGIIRWRGGANEWDSLPALKLVKEASKF